MSKLIKVRNKTGVEKVRTILTEERVKLLRYIFRKEPKSIKQIEKGTGRDYRNITRDIKVLEQAKMIKLQQVEDSLVPIVDYDKIEIEVSL